MTLNDYLVLKFRNPLGDRKVTFNLPVSPRSVISSSLSSTDQPTNMMMRAALLFLTISISLVASKPAPQIQNSLFSQSSQNNFGLSGGIFPGGFGGNRGFGGLGGFGGFGSGFGIPGNTQNCQFSQCNQNNFGK